MRMGGDGAPSHCWECKLVLSLWKTVWLFFFFFKQNSAGIILSTASATMLLDIYLRHLKTISTKTCTQISVVALFTFATELGNKQDVLH